MQIPSEKFHLSNLAGLLGLRRKPEEKRPVNNNLSEPR